MMKRLLVVGALASLVACGGGHQPHEMQAIMFNPETKMTAECSADPIKDGQFQFKDKLNHCIAGYQAAGYKRVDPVK